MELLRPFPATTGFAWPKVFSPKVIIRDGKGCLEPQYQNTSSATDVSGTLDWYQRSYGHRERFSPELLDLRQPARSRHCVEGDAKCRQASSGEESRACCSRYISDSSHRKDTRQCLCGTDNISSHNVPSDSQTFPATGCQEQSELSSTQDVRNLDSVHQYFHVHSDWVFFRRSPEPGDKVSCSGTWISARNLNSPPSASYPDSAHRPYLSDLPSSCCPLEDGSVRTPRTSSDLGTSSLLASADWTSRKSECTHTVAEDGAINKAAKVCTCQSCSTYQNIQSLKYEETKYLQATPTCAKMVSAEKDLDLNAFHPQCSCVSVKNEGNHDHPCPNKNRSRVEESDDFCVDDKTSVKRGTNCYQNNNVGISVGFHGHSEFPRESMSPTDKARRKYHSEVPNSNLYFECTEDTSQGHSNITKISADPVSYHGIWTVTKAKATDLIPVSSFITDGGKLWSDFLLNFPGHFRQHCDFREDAVGELCQCQEHGRTVDLSNLGAQHTHEGSQWRETFGCKRNPRIPEDSVCNKCSSDSHTQWQMDIEQPYDLSTKHVDNGPEHHTDDDKQASMSTGQNSSWNPHTARSACCNGCAFRNTSNINDKQFECHSCRNIPQYDTTSHWSSFARSDNYGVRPVMSLPNASTVTFQSPTIRDISRSAHQDIAGVYGDTARLFVPKKDDDSSTNSSECLQRRSHDSCSPDRGVQCSTHSYVWSSQSGHKEDITDTTDCGHSPPQCTAVCRHSQSLTGQQTQGMFYAMPSSAAWCTQAGQQRTPKDLPPTTHQPELPFSSVTVETGGNPRHQPLQATAMVSTTPSSPYMKTDRADTSSSSSQNVMLLASHATAPSHAIHKTQPQFQGLYPTASHTPHPTAPHAPHPTAPHTPHPTVPAAKPTEERDSYTIASNTEIHNDTNTLKTQQQFQGTHPTASRNPQNKASPPQSVQGSDSHTQQHVQAGKKRRTRLRTFQCHLCSVACSNRGQLKGHLRTHTGERPFPCLEPGCNKTFVRNEELTRHRRIHSGERPYACNTCGKAFTRKDHLNKHVRMHTEPLGAAVVELMDLS